MFYTINVKVVNWLKHSKCQVYSLVLQLISTIFTKYIFWIHAIFLTILFIISFSISDWGCAKFKSCNFDFKFWLLSYMKTGVIFSCMSLCIILAKIWTLFSNDHVLVIMCMLSCWKLQLFDSSSRHQISSTWWGISYCGWN